MANKTSSFEINLIGNNTLPLKFRSVTFVGGGRADMYRRRGRSVDGGSGRQHHAARLRTRQRRRCRGASASWGVAQHAGRRQQRRHLRGGKTRKPAYCHLTHQVKRLVMFSLERVYAIFLYYISLLYLEPLGHPFPNNFLFLELSKILGNMLSL